MLLLIAKLSNPKSNSNQGFTLIELIVVFIIIGVMSVIVGPSMLGFLSRGKVNSAQSNLLGALQESQREAIKRSTNCNMDIPVSGTSGSLTISGSCLISGERTLNEVTLRHNLVDISSTYDGTDDDLFDFKGRTDDFLANPSDASAEANLIFVIYRENNDTGTDSFQKCIVVSDGLGLIRYGIYSDTSTTNTLNPALCSPSS